MIRSSIDFAAVNNAAMSCVHTLLLRLLPDGKQEGSEWVARNPRRHDRRAGSFKVNTSNGRWCDFSSGDKGGDLVALYAFLEGLSQVEAARELARELGVRID